MRPYEGSHQWITYSWDMSGLSHKSWMLLGEISSKCAHIGGVPLRPETAARLNEIYLSKGIHGTTSIEGNTLSEDEVLQRVRGQLNLPKSREYLGTEIDNVLNACNMVIGEVIRNKPLPLTPERVGTFNRMVLKDLELKEGVVPGKLRRHSVAVAGYRGAPAEDCEFLLDQLCKTLDSIKVDDQDMRFPVAIFKAVMAHLYIAWIHPFGDGNGRTARLIEFQLLVEAGVPLPAAHLLSDHYNATRERYYLQLDRTSKPPFKVDSFVHYALEGFCDELRSQLADVRTEQMRVTWENYVHEQFRDQETTAKRRQKHLVLDLPDDQPVLASALPTLTPRLAVDYAGKQSKTVTRDINALFKMNLIRRVRGGIVANRDRILAFLPLTVDTD